MKMIEHTVKKYLLVGILLFLLLPLMQQYTGLFNVKDLKGAQEPLEKPALNKTVWLNGKYQEAYEAWFNENFGFRNTCIRLRNQIGYDLYNTAYANGVIIGKDDYLYELNYIKAYTGQDFIGEKDLGVMIDKIKAVQDSLEKMGTTLLVCFAPGKASYYPEYIPDRFGKGVDTTNYKVMLKLCNDKHVNLIDFNGDFMRRKASVPSLLYPKTGIHWSRYGTMHAFDSIVKWIEHKRGIDMPDIIFDNTYQSDSLHSPDDDIGEAMNLMWPIKPLTMTYQNFHYEDTTGKAKVSMMAISDSFFWSIFDSNPTPSPFTGIDFYYYDRAVYRRDGSPQAQADPETSVLDAKKNNVVILMATECNVWGIGWGFVDDAYAYFVKHQSLASSDKMVHYYEGAIRLDAVWLKQVQLKAEEQGIPLDSMIHLDAVYMVEQKIKEGMK